MTIRLSGRGQGDQDGNSRKASRVSRLGMAPGFWAGGESIAQAGRVAAGMHGQWGRIGEQCGFRALSGGSLRPLSCHVEHRNRLRRRLPLVHRPAPLVGRHRTGPPGHPGSACRKRWLPFFLNPDTLPEGEPHLPFLIIKSSVAAAVEAIFGASVRPGRAHGVDYAFEKIQVRANTLDAHRLAGVLAQQQGTREAGRGFVRRPVPAGENVGDRAVLGRVAAEAGYDAGRWRRGWRRSRAREVLAEERAVRAPGGDSVPTFIFDRRHAVVGAEDPAVLAEAIRHRWKVCADGITAFQALACPLMATPAASGHELALCCRPLAFGHLRPGLRPSVAGPAKAPPGSWGTARDGMPGGAT